MGALLARADGLAFQLLNAHYVCIVWLVVGMEWGAALLTPRNLREFARAIPLHFLSAA